MLQANYSDLIDKNSSFIPPSQSPEYLNENNTYYLFDSKLLSRHLKAKPSKEMYLYFPSQEEICEVNPKNEKDILRRMFNNVKFTNYENKKIIEFYEYIRNNNKKEKKNKFFFPQYWNDGESVRFLQANNFDIKDTKKAIQSNLQWLNNLYPFNIDLKTKAILNSGLIYMFGRDKHYRPVLIIEANKNSELTDKKKLTLEDISKAIIFFLNYIINNIFIKCQIENWTLICDLENIGVTELNKFKKIIEVVNKFRGRVYKNFIINMGGFLSFTAKGLISLFGNSSKKMQILGKSDFKKELTNIINPNQLQKKYGGLCDDIVYGNDNLFPPIIPSDEYNLPSDKINIIDEEKYKKMCNEGIPFKPYDISNEYLEKWENERKIKEEEELNKLKEEEKKRQEEIEKEKEIVRVKTLNDVKFNEFEINEFLSHFINKPKTKIKKYIIPQFQNIKKVGEMLHFNNINNNSPF
jgi:hypothetical protein